MQVRPSPGMTPDACQNYLLVAKPGMVLGNLISAAAGFFLASKGRVDGAALSLATLIGISLVVASGCVFNNCVDRKIDRKMVRTRNRALAKGVISLKSPVSYATILGIAGMALLCAATNLLTVVITLAGLVIYVVVYSLYMKRSSVYSTLIGSLAGAAPPLAGYCAVTGSFDLGALILLSIFTLWQMPHCYAIAVYRLDDYTAAGIPVLPVKHGTACAAATCIRITLRRSRSHPSPSPLCGAAFQVAGRLESLPHKGRGFQIPLPRRGGRGRVDLDRNSMHLAIESTWSVIS